MVETTCEQSDTSPAVSDDVVDEPLPEQREVARIVSDAVCVNEIVLLMRPYEEHVVSPQHRQCDTDATQHKELSVLWELFDGVRREEVWDRSHSTRVHVEPHTLGYSELIGHFGMDEIVDGLEMQVAGRWIDETTDSVPRHHMVGR